MATWRPVKRAPDPSVADSDCLASAGSAKRSATWQWMKERGVEHVRYRAVGDFNHVAIQAVLQGMLTEAYRYHCHHKS